MNGKTIITGLDSIESFLWMRKKSFFFLFFSFLIWRRVGGNDAYKSLFVGFSYSSLLGLIFYVITNIRNLFTFIMWNTFYFHTNYVLLFVWNLYKLNNNIQQLRLTKDKSNFDYWESQSFLLNNQRFLK